MERNEGDFIVFMISFILYILYNNNLISYDTIIKFISDPNTYAITKGLFLRREAQMQNTGIGKMPCLRSFQAIPGKRYK